jgi:hypothetical protein
MTHYNKIKSDWTIFHSKTGGVITHQQVINLTIACLHGRITTA